MRKSPQAGAGSWDEGAPAAQNWDADGYWLKSLKQTVKGDYTPDSERTLAGTVGEIAAGVTPLAGTAASVRDLSENLTNWKWTWGHGFKLGANLLGVIPLFKGPLKALRALGVAGDAAQAAGNVEKFVAKAAREA